MSAAGEKTLLNVSDDEDVGHLSDNDDESNLHVTPHHQLPFSMHSDFASNLFKWTNYINGWQERFIVLKDGVLSYYRSQSEMNYGCRGAITIKQSTIITHELDDCRFDIKVNDSVWYLRARTVEERQKWLEALSYEQRGANGSGPGLAVGYSNLSNLKRHGSMQSINSTVSLSMASNDSNTYKGFNGLKEKLDEMETFKNILCKQIDTLQVYFDACLNAANEGAFETTRTETPPLSTKGSSGGGVDSDNEDEAAIAADLMELRLKERIKNRVKDHAAMGLDFKSEAYTFKATAAGILHELTHCIDSMHQREDYWRSKLEKEKDSRRRLEEKYRQLSEEKKNKIIIAGPDFEEGPFCNANEEFLDAIDTMLDTLEEEEERRVQAFESLTNLPKLKPVLKHRLSESVDKVVGDHLEFDLVDDLDSDIWELLCSDGDMRVYRRPLEENGIVLDPLKAVHKVQGITAHELCRYFWDPVVRMEWELTLDSSRVVEALSDDTLIFHQVHKKVWPTAQRDTCFWSHLRHFKKQLKEKEVDGWICVNYSMEDDRVPRRDPIIRAIANVAMICSTEIIDEEKFPDRSKVPRENVVCHITYVANVNPGGWVPAGVIRKVYKTVIPKIVKQFSQHVIDKSSKKPIMF